MNIAILGTRGIPNYYGGFEQFAEYLAKELVNRGHAITVYNSTSHPYQEPTWNGVKLVHCNDPEDKWGTVGQFIYDLNCIRHARTQNYDIILQLGYTSSSIWGWLLPKKSVITTNMDGLEWMRTKYKKPVQWFLRFAEYLGVVFSDHLISDSIGIQDYIKKKYNTTSIYIPYGAYCFENPEIEQIEEQNLGAYTYNMLIARLEPENNVEMILDGVLNSDTSLKFLVIGNSETAYGKYLKSKYYLCEKIQFLGSIYNLEYLNNLRHFSNLYFHGHSVGGTNPSLLEAMGSNSLICAHENPFNKAILGEDAFYFKDKEQVTQLLQISKQQYVNHVVKNCEKIRSIYSWDSIIDQYEKHFVEILSNSQ